MPRSVPTLLGLAAFLACGGTTAPVRVDSVVVTPALLELVLGVAPSGALTATARDAAGTAITGRAVTWEALTPSVASVSASGLVTAVGPGTATIRATVDGVTGTAAVQVALAPVAFVAVALGSASLEPTLTTQATATLRDAAGNPLTGRAVVWTSSAPAIASVSDLGMVRGVAAGTAQIVASSEGVSGSAQVRVFDEPPNLTLDGFHLSQAVQRAGGTVPLVAGGHPALLSVFGTLDRPFSPGAPAPVVRVALYHGSTEVLVDERPMNGVPGPDVQPLVPMHQVVLPPELLEPGLGVVATVNPAAVLHEATASDNVWPRSGLPAEIDVRAVPPLEVHFVPIHLSIGGSTGNVSPGTMAEYLYATRQMHPVAGIIPTIGSTFTSDVAFGDGQAAAWVAILADLDLLRVAEGTSRYYVGALRPPPGIGFVQFGGFAYIPGNPASTGPSTRTALVVGVGWFDRQRQTTELVAHELGHTMGRRHAPCGGAAGPDPAYPYGGGLIGAQGHDLYTWSLTGSGLPVGFGPLAAADVMSYCTPAWISDYNYEALLAARLAAAASVSPGEPCDCLIVRGEVEAGVPKLLPAFTMATRAALPIGAGRYSLIGERRDGSPVFSYRFEPAEIDHAPSVGHFTFAIPLTESEREAIVRLRVTAPGGSAELSARTLSAAARGALPGAGPVLVGRQAGAVELRWPADAWPAALVRDAATGVIVAMGRSGRLVVPGSSGELEVLLSDGIRTEVTRVRP